MALRFQCETKSTHLIGVSGDSEQKSLMYLFSFLRSIPIRRPAFCAPRNFLLARHPFIPTAQALQFLKLDFHSHMDTLKDSREQPERRAAILQSVFTDRLAA